MESKFNDLSLRAAIDQSTVNVSERSFEATLVTDTPIFFNDWRYSDNGREMYSEVLPMETMRSERMEIGIPLFPSHWERSATNQLGITTEYVKGDRACKVKVKLGARADDILWQDIQNGITKTVSVGTRIYTVERSTAEGKIVYTAKDWEPMHVALAPEPADTECTTNRSATTVINIEPEKVDEPESFFNSLINKF